MTDCISNGLKSNVNRSRMEVDDIWTGPGGV
jgi:hypothetical protein